MIISEMESVIHFRHSPEEVSRLNEAIGPMMSSIRVVARGYDRLSLKRILGGEFFRAHEAASVRNMLLRAVKHSRATLNEYFPLMQQDVLTNAQALEDAVAVYWLQFQYLREEILPTH